MSRLKKSAVNKVCGISGLISFTKTFYFCDSPCVLPEEKMVLLPSYIQYMTDHWFETKQGLLNLEEVEQEPFSCPLLVSLVFFTSPQSLDTVGLLPCFIRGGKLFSKGHSISFTSPLVLNSPQSPVALPSGSLQGRMVCPPRGQTSKWVSDGSPD